MPFLPAGPPQPVQRALVHLEQMSCAGLTPPGGVTEQLHFGEAVCGGGASPPVLDENSGRPLTFLTTLG